MAELEPTIDHVRVLHGSCLFGPLSREHWIPLPDADGAQLVELYLTAFGRSAPFGDGPYVRASADRYTFPREARILIANTQSDRPVDITDRLLGGINDSLRRNQNVAEGQYRKAVDRSRRELDTLAEPRPFNLTPLAASNAPSKLETIDKLGTDGGDAFHPFNYLFRDVTLPPQPLIDLIKRELIRNPAQITDPLRIDAILITGTSGRIDYTIEAVYHNGLADLFDDLQQRIRRALLDIRDKVRAGGNLMQAAADAKDIAMGTARQVQELQRAVEDQKIQIATLASDLQEIKKLLAGR
jgi:hypothetical protein